MMSDFKPRIISPEMSARGYNNLGRGKLIGYVTDKSKHEETCDYRLRGSTCNCRVGLWQETGPAYVMHDDECRCAQCAAEDTVPDHPHPLKPLTGHDVFKASELTSYAKGVQDTLKDRIGDAKARKATPLFSGCINYFPDALLAVAELSRIGNDQHNPGQPLHWDRSKSSDELDALARHLVDAGTIDTDNVRHSTKVAWRALANLQKEIEKDRNR